MTSRCADVLAGFSDALARAHGYAAYAQSWDHHRDIARTLVFEGHMKWAEAMR